MRCCRCKLKINSGSWCPACRKEYNDKYYNSRIGKKVLKSSQSKYQKTENGKEAQKYANQRYLKKQSRIIGAIMSGVVDDFKKFIEEEIKAGVKEENIKKSKLYFKTITLWHDTLVKVGRVKGSFNGSWKNRNYKDVKQYYKDGGTFEEFVELCDWLIWPSDEKGADERTKRILKYISGLIEQSNNASTFRIQRQIMKKQGNKTDEQVTPEIKRLNDQINKRKSKGNYSGGYNG